jgi:glycosyltransferase involved in cell wall biosynthesis
MRIAQVAPLSEAVPPSLYGGTERVIWWLTEALIEAGHDVTLFASGDSRSSAQLVPCADRGLRLAGINDHLAHTVVMLDRVLQAADDFDIIHFHVDILQYPMFRHLAHKCVTTLHGRQDFPDSWPAYDAFPEAQLVSISNSQRQPIPQGNFVGTVLHGLPTQLVPFGRGSGEYLAFLGRISPEKRPDRAIEIAKKAGVPLKIAAKVDRVDRAYFEDEIEPLLDHPLIEFVGELGDADKGAFLGDAAALLFPVDWPEPFGLVMIEAMAAGTPVVAWTNGSTPEVIEPGRSGFLVDSLEAAVEAVIAARALPRERVRAAFEERFTAQRMAADYLAIYRRLHAAAPIPDPERYLITAG